MIIPKIKKKISSFLLEEEGKISKKEIIKAGVLVLGVSSSALVITDLVNAGHSNSFTESGDCVSHSSSHSNHSSHQSGGWC